MNGDPDDVFRAIDLYELYGLADHPVIAAYLQSLKDKATSKILNEKAKYTEHLAHFAGKRSLDAYDLRPETLETKEDTVGPDGDQDRPAGPCIYRELPIERLFRYVDVTDEANRLAVPLSPPSAVAGVPAVTAGRPESGMGNDLGESG